MNRQPLVSRFGTLGAAVLGLLAVGAGVYFWWPDAAPEAPAAVAFTMPPSPPEASSEQVHQFCGACHAYPPPNTFPRAAWRREVKQAYDFFHNSKLQIPMPSMESVALYYERRAPAELPLLEQKPPVTPLPLRFQRKGYALPGNNVYPAVTNVNLVHLFDKQKRDILVCEARLDQVLVLKPYTEPPTWHVLGTVVAPAHAEVVDLDGDKHKDVLVASLGSFAATDSKLGGVVWLRGAADGTFTPIPLLEAVGRVADVQAADFRGNGKLDLVVAVFGWRNTGEILYLENRTTDWAKPVFVKHVLDDRHGAVQVCVVDLDGDGKLDVVALISQEHEMIVAYLNRGEGRFDKKTLYEAPHPAYGSSGIQLVDLNGDGKLDILYTNGDSLDPPYLLKPYHSVQWLENRGGGKFEHHPLTAMYGAMRAVAADFRGGGQRDIVAVSFLARDHFPQRASLKLDAMILLEQVGKGNYVRHALETITCDHFTCAVGDLYGDGKAQLVTGSFGLSRQHAIADAVTLWTPLPLK
jgi:hypothetical protein